MKKPNFFIIGAPKCGTTALYYYLKGHPQVFMPDLKEPHYFMQEPAVWEMRTQEQYLALFSAAGARHLRVGESSTHYITSIGAVRRILQFEPEVRLIAMLRNPLEMVQSWHGQLLASCHETEVSFEKAWRLQNTRRAGREIPKLCKKPSVLQYGRIARLGHHVEQLLLVVPKQQIRFVLQEEFVLRTKEVYEDVLAFLSLGSDGRSYFPRKNVARTARHPWLTRLIRQPPFPLNVLKRTLRTNLGVRGTGMGERICDWNARQASRPPLSHDLRCELVEHFTDDVNKLADILGRDLSHWLSYSDKTEHRAA